MSVHSSTKDLPNFDHSFLDLLNQGFENFPDRVCCQSGAQVLTYAEVDTLSAKVANQLVQSGFEVGFKGAIYSLNSVETLIATVGVIRAGGVWVPINPRNSLKDNLGVLARFEVSALFYQSAFLEAAQSIDNGSRLIVALDNRATDHIFWRDWCADADSSAPSVELDGASLMSLPQTGGTTGSPKGVMLNHSCFNANAYNSAQLNPRTEQVWLCAAPMTHVGGRIALCVMPRGARLVIMDRVDLDLVLELIQREKVTDLFLPPTAIYTLLDHPRLNEYDLSSVRQLGYGSAPMNIERLKEAIQRLGPVMSGGYGQTECPMSISSFRPDQHMENGQIVSDQRLRSVGRETPVSTVRIMGEDGELVGPNVEGEIVIRGPTVASGYYQDPEETAAIRRNDWHLTGDIGYLDDEGFLYICDRKKDMIITGGFNVYSVEVERVMAEFPGIKQAAVVGLPDEKWGEIVTAAVITDPSVSLSEAALLAYIKEHLGSVKTPKRLELVDELPLTPLGKVDKKALRKILEP